MLKLTQRFICNEKALKGSPQKGAKCPKREKRFWSIKEGVRASLETNEEGVGRR